MCLIGLSRSQSWLLPLRSDQTGTGDHSTMTSYIVNVQMPHDRETSINQAKTATKEVYAIYEYQNQRTDLPVVRLDVGIPIYRMANFRTRTAQIKYIHERDVASDFFSSGQENESAQRAQHDILVTFAGKGRSSSVTPIVDQLQAEEQREPLLVTSGGIVVNGNRRLAAMRELFTQNPVQFSHFAYVDCAVLPSSVTSRELVEIEVRLQMRPETKLPYGWIEESIAVREMLHKGLQSTYVADLIKKKPKEVQTAERALTEVDIYLKEWLGAPENYQRVEDAEQFFNDLAKALVGVEGEMLEAKRRIAWTLLTNTDLLPGRIYDYGFSFDKKTSEVVAALNERLSINPDTTSVVDSVAHDDEPLQIDFGDVGADVSLEKLIKAFDDPDQRETVGEELVDVCVSINERTRQLRVGNQALTAIRTANTKLMSVDLSKAAPKTYEPILAQLAAIKEQVAALEQAVSTYVDFVPPAAADE